MRRVVQAFVWVLVWLVISIGDARAQTCDSTYGGALLGADGIETGAVGSGQGAAYTLTMPPLSTFSFSLTFSDPVPPGTVTIRNAVTGLVLDVVEVGTHLRVLIPGPAIGTIDNDSASDALPIEISIENGGTCVGFEMTWTLAARCPYVRGSHHEGLSTTVGSRSGLLGAPDEASYGFVLQPLDELSFTVAFDDAGPHEVWLVDVDAAMVLGTWTVGQGTVEGSWRNPSIIDLKRVVLFLRTESECVAFELTWSIDDRCEFVAVESLVGDAGTTTGQILSAAVHYVVVGPFEELTFTLTVDPSVSGEVYLVQDGFSATYLHLDVIGGVVTGSWRNPTAEDRVMRLEFAPTGGLCVDYTLDWALAFSCVQQSYVVLDGTEGTEVGSVASVAIHEVHVGPFEELTIALTVDPGAGGEVYLIESGASFLHLDVIDGAATGSWRNPTADDRVMKLVFEPTGSQCVDYTLDWALAFSCVQQSFVALDGVGGSETGTVAIAAIHEVSVGSGETLSLALTVDDPASTGSLVAYQTEAPYLEVMVADLVDGHAAGTWTNHDASPRIMRFAFDNDGGMCVGYELDWEIVPACLDAEDPNDGPDEAAPVDGVRTDLALAFGDEDWFSVTLAPGEGLEAVATFDDPGVHLLAVRTEDGDLVDFAFATDAAPHEAVVAWTHDGRFAGTYLLYVLTLSECVRYDLSVERFGSCPVDALEPNDTRLTATLLPAGRTLEPDLAVGGADVDWFLATVPSGGTLTVEVPLLDESQDLVIRGALGELLADSVVVEDRRGARLVATFANTWRLPRPVWVEVDSEACVAYDLYAAVCGRSGCR